MKRGIVFGLLLLTCGVGVPASDYYRLGEIPTPEERMSDVARWAAQFGVRDLRYSPEGSRFCWPESVFYLYVTPDGHHKVYVHPALRHAYMWLQEPDGRALENDDDVASKGLDSLRAAKRMLEARPDLQRYTWALVGASPGAALFRQALPSGILGQGRRRYFFDKRNGELTGAVEHLYGDEDHPAPAISYEQAADLVRGWVTKAVGDRLLAIKPMASVDAAQWAGAPQLLQDALQVERASHVLTAVISQTGDVTAEHYREMSEAWREMEAEDRPFLVYPSFLIDAMTGEARDIDTTDDFIPERRARRISLVVQNRRVHAAYPPVVVNQRAYLYAKYLDSFLWHGHLERQGSVIVVSVADEMLTADLSDGQITGSDLEHSVRAHVEHDRVYLPTDMIKKLTGWNITYDDHRDAVTIEVPAELLPKMRLLTGPR